MFLTFIIPVYNGENYLAECLDSLLDQDLPESEYEIICVDDESKDASPEILKQYAAEHENIRLVFKKHAAFNSRNRGVEMSNGDYIWLVDQDDLILPQSLGFLQKMLLETGCDRLYFRYYEFPDELTDRERKLIAEHKIRPNSGDGKENSVVWSSVFKKQFLMDNDVWPHSKRLGYRSGGFGSDAFFISECREANAVEYKLTDLPFYFYRKHSDQSVSVFSDALCKKRIQCALDYPIIFKEEYEKAVQEKGHADFKETMELVAKTRHCAQAMQKLPRKWAKVGMQRMRDAGLYPLELPDIYKENYSWLDCVKAKNGMGPLKSIAFYYSTKPLGLALYTLLDVRTHLEVIRNSSPLAQKARRTLLQVMNYLRNMRS